MSMELKLFLIIMGIGFAAAIIPEINNLVDKHRKKTKS